MWGAKSNILIDLNYLHDVLALQQLFTEEYLRRGVNEIDDQGTDAENA